MERTPGDLSGHGGALVPATGSLATASTGSQPNTMAGTNPTPMTVDEGFFNQPAQAYFQFVQNNLTYINEGMLLDKRQKRGTQIMEQKVQQLYQEFEQVCLSETAQQRAEAERRHEHMTAEHAVSRTAAEQEVTSNSKGK